MLLSRRTELALRTLERLAAPPAMAFDTGDAALDGIAVHSLTVACAAERLAAELVAVYGADAGIEPAGAFDGGLWHDVGKLALAAAFPRAFGRVVAAAELVRGDFADAERRVIGVDHLLAGKRAAEHWGLSAAVRDCAWLHGQHPGALPAGVANPRLVHVVTLADQIAREGRAGYSGNYGGFVPRPVLLDAIGVGEEQVARVVEGLSEAVEARRGKEFLCEPASGKPRIEPLAASQENPDRSELNSSKEQNHQVAADQRSAVFVTKNADCGPLVRSYQDVLSAISRFHSIQANDPTVSDALALIARSASNIFNQPAATFGLVINRGYAETVVVDPAGTALHAGVAEAGEWAGESAGGEPVRRAGDALEWVRADVEPHLTGGDGATGFIPFRAAGRTVGGILWPAGDDQIDQLNQSEAFPALIAAWSMALRSAQVRDESRRLAEQLAESNRRLQAAREEVERHRAHAAVGEVAAGAAHEMNNPLMVISGRSQLLAASLSDERQRAAAQQIAEQSQRLSDMITSLMDYARPRPPRLETVDLIGLIGAALALAKRQTDPADRTVVVDVAPEVPPVRADAGQLAEAVAEAVANAYQATGPAGRVAVSGRYDAYSGRVVLSVEDDGCGMSGETAQHAFDPFFSAKPAGRRRGMGLATALRKVEAGGGSVRLDSRPGGGTRATFLLPAADPIPLPARRRKSA